MENSIVNRHLIKFLHICSKIPPILVLEDKTLFTNSSPHPMLCKSLNLMESQGWHWKPLWFTISGPSQSHSSLGCSVLDSRVSIVERLLSSLKIFLQLFAREITMIAWDDYGAVHFKISGLTLHSKSQHTHVFHRRLLVSFDSLFRLSTRRSSSLIVTQASLTLSRLFVFKTIFL